MLEPQKNEKKKKEAAASAAAPSMTHHDLGSQGERVTRAGSRRFKAKAAGAGEPPEGLLDDAAVDRLLARWRAMAVKSADDYVRYDVTKISADARNLLQGYEEDLEVFVAFGAPVDVRHFQWLLILNNRLVKADAEAVALRARGEILERDAHVAVGGVLKARQFLSRVGQAGGVSASLMGMRATGKAPRKVLAEAERVAHAARLLLQEFHHVEVALKAIGGLEAATATLRAVVDEQHRLATIGRLLASQRAALAVLTYDALLYLSWWGRAAVGDDETKAQRYRLATLFPKRAKKEKKKEAPAPAAPSPSAPLDRPVD